MSPWLIIPAVGLAALIVRTIAGAIALAHEIDRDERIAS